MNTDLRMKRLRRGDRVGTARERVEGWPGYVRRGVFVIEKKIRGVKFHVSTRCTTLRAAMRELERFELDPAAYVEPPPEPVPEARLVLDEELVEAFFAWHSRRVTRAWALDVRRRLYDWGNHLAGRDLRQLELMRDLRSHVDGATQRHHRVKAIRALFKWLRQERGLVTRAQDATLDLPVPVLQPAARRKSKVMELELVVETLPHLRADVRDVVELLATTGWHVSEVARFATEGTMRDRVTNDAPEVLAVIGVTHKSGRQHFTALTTQRQVDVAARIRARGHVIDRGALRKHLAAAAHAVTLERRRQGRTQEAQPLKLGAFRHSVSTWLRQDGVADDAISRYLGHVSPVTTRRFYIDGERAPVVVPAAGARLRLVR